VSSPADHGSGTTGFLVTFERFGAARGILLQTNAGSALPEQPFDLTASFGAGPDTPRVDSDGLRYVLSSSQVNPNSPFPNATELRTLAHDGSALQLHDGPRVLPGSVFDPRIAAQRASGGEPGAYAVAYMRLETGGLRPYVTRYGGHAPGAMTTVLPTACNGLTIGSSGSSVLGAALQFDLGNYGANVPGFAFGGASANSVPLCPACALGLRADLPILLLLGSPQATIAIPPSVGLVGESFGMQGVSVGAGPCLSALSLSDTVQFTIR
jgi:hypothetical protein